jgi:D-hydroxyproline dehydrogenase subunit beta
MPMTRDLNLMPPSRVTAPTYDLAIVGAGMVGLAHAYAAAKLGKRVVVLDRHQQSSGAGAAGYGLHLVTGQHSGIAWQRSLRSREILLEIGKDAGIAMDQRGLMTVAVRPEGLDLIESFASSAMGEGCQLLSPVNARKRVPVLNDGGFLGALWSPHELRYETRGFCASLSRWLAETRGVAFMRGVHVRSVFPSRIDTSAGPVRAEAVIVCPGEEMLALFPSRIANYRLTLCRVQMLRVTPGKRLRLPVPVQTDLGLLASPGFAELPDARNLAVRLASERGDPNAPNIRLLAVQTTDRSLVIGDGRVTAPSADPFMPASAEQQILAELDRVLEMPDRLVVERWAGAHVVADRPLIIDRPTDAVRLVIPTGGFGASMAFAVAEEVVAGLFGSTASSVAPGAQTLE